MKRRFLAIKKFNLIVAGFGVLLLFQNCGTKFAPQTYSSSSSSTGDIQSVGYAARFEAAKDVIKRNCASCHYEGAPGGSLLFNSENEYINAKLITPGSISTSKMILRLRNYPVMIENRTMPPPGPISSTDYATLTAWVESMALPSSSTDLFQCSASEGASTLDARRLSKTELLNSLRRMLARPFGTTEAEQILTANASTFMARMPVDNRTPFSRSDRSFESTHADAYFDLAEELANAVTSSARYSRLVTTFVNYAPGACTGLNVTTLSTACRDAFISNFLLRLWGRPVDASIGELAAYQAEFNGGVTSTQAVNNFVFRALLSPPFINHLYIDVTPVAGQPAKLSSFAVARRLSYHFQLAGLDEAMVQLASQSDLSQDTGFAVALNNVSLQPTPMIQDFVDDWLKLYKVQSIVPPTSAKWNRVAAGITFDSSLNAAMRQEVLDLVTYLYQNGRPVQELLTSNVSLARHSELMKIYGQTTAAPSSVTEANAVRLPAAERAGILTRAGYLYASGDTERPVMRGLHLMGDILCTSVKGSAPPGAAMTPIPEGIMTTRQKYTQVTSGAACIGCHAQINPLGYAFSKYNAFGKFQQSEPVFVSGAYSQDLPVDAVVNLQASLQDSTNVDGGPALSQWISKSTQFNACFSRQYQTYVQRLNTVPTTTSSCDMRRMSDVIRNNGSVQDFLRAPAADARFRRRDLIQ